MIEFDCILINAKIEDFQLTLTDENKFDKCNLVILISCIVNIQKPIWMWINEVPEFDSRCHKNNISV